MMSLKLDRRAAGLLIRSSFIIASLLPASTIAFTSIYSSSSSSSKRRQETTTRSLFSNSFHKPQQRISSSSSIVKSGYDDENSEYEQSPDNNHSNNVMKRVVLIGGGHAHAQVIKAYNASSRPDDLHVTLIDVQESASYSGMVPGCVAGLYKPEDTLLDLQALSDWSDIEFINDKVIDIDLDSKLIYLEKREENNNNTIQFDVVSLDIGSTSRNLDAVKGASQYTIPTRPISKLVQRMEDATDDLVKKQNCEDFAANVVVIGGGAAGIELAMSIHGRWNLLNSNKNNDDKKEIINVTVLDAGYELLPYESESNRKALVDVLNSKNIKIVHGCQVEEIYQDHIKVIEKDSKTTGEKDINIPFTHCIWATGAGPHDLALKLSSKGGLATTQQGWIRVNDQFQSISHPYVFAAGDCCNVEGLPNGRSLPKAGVFAVRAGPVLIENLSKMLFLKEVEDDDDGSSPLLTSYEPQDDFLKLLICGDGKAIGFRFGIPFHGKWVFEMKNEIDQSFMDLFRAEKLPPKPTNNDDGSAPKMDTSQYDSNFDDKPTRLSSEDAAQLIQRTDDDVDFRLAWSTLREMAADDNYRLEVLKYMKDRIPISA